MNSRFGSGLRRSKIHRLHPGPRARSGTPPRARNRSHESRTQTAVHCPACRPAPSAQGSSSTANALPGAGLKTMALRNAILRVRGVGVSKNAVSQSLATRTEKFHVSGARRRLRDRSWPPSSPVASSMRGPARGDRWWPSRHSSTPAADRRARQSRGSAAASARCASRRSRAGSPPLYRQLMLRPARLMHTSAPSSVSTHGPSCFAVPVNRLPRRGVGSARQHRHLVAALLKVRAPASGPPGRCRRAAQCAAAAVPEIVHGFSVQLSQVGIAVAEGSG